MLLRDTETATDPCWLATAEEEEATDRSLSPEDRRGVERTGEEWRDRRGQDRTGEDRRGVERSGEEWRDRKGQDRTGEDKRG